MHERKFLILSACDSGIAIDTLLEFGELKLSAAENAIDPEEFLFNKDQSKILISTQSQTIYRHSAKAAY